MRKFLLFFILIFILGSCQSWFKKRNEPLSGVWLETALIPECQKLIENRVKFQNLVCGRWNNLHFYLEKFFHVQSLSFKDTQTGNVLFNGKGEMSGGACFLGISAYATGESLSILADKNKSFAQAMVFEMAAIDVNSNKEVKGFCTIKFDHLKKKWCGLGSTKTLTEGRKLALSNPDC